MYRKITLVSLHHETLYIDTIEKQLDLLERKFPGLSFWDGFDSLETRVREASIEIAQNLRPYDGQKFWVKNRFGQLGATPAQLERVASTTAKISYIIDWLKGRQKYTEDDYRNWPVGPWRQIIAAFNELLPIAQPTLEQHAQLMAYARQLAKAISVEYYFHAELK